MGVSVVTTEADAIIANKERAKRHSVSERSPDVEDVMATITRPADLTWSKTLCWAVNDPGPDGRPKLSVETTIGEVRHFYQTWRDEELTVGSGPLISGLASRWYTFSDSVGTPLQNQETQAVRTIDSVVLFLMDGPDGISAEICWRRVADVSLSAAERGERTKSFLAALRQQDVNGLLALMSPSVQGAVRDYFDADPPFVLIDGRAAMRAHYEKFFKRVEVVDVAVVNSIIRSWFVFNELRWVVRLRTGPNRGREMKFLTAEHMPFDVDGLFQARSGYGTEME